VEVLWPLIDLPEDQKPTVAVALAELLEHPSHEIRIYLLQVLAELGTKTVLAAISKAESELDDKVKSAAKAARQKIEQIQI
jgi:HEAT repeat protein